MGTTVTEGLKADSKVLIGRKHSPDFNKEAHRLLAEYQMEARQAEDSLAGVEQLQKQTKHQLKSIVELLPANKGQYYQEDKAAAAYFVKHKHTFVYGKRGLGRFLSSEARDVVRMSDALKNLNPVFPFMAHKLSGDLAKEL